MSEFKNLPSGWKVVRLDKVAPLQRGYDLPADNVKEGLYPVVYSNGILKFHNEFKAKAPGVITGRSGTIGKVIYVEKDYWPHNTSLWVINFCDNNPKFIYYMYINLNLIRFSAGSGVPTLNRNDIHSQKILLPPLDEQEKIAEILSTWDEAINLTINLIESKKQFKKALMQNLLTAKIRFPEFKNEWLIVKLEEVSEIYQPQTISQSELTDSGFDVYGANGIIGKYSRYNHEFEQVVVTCRGNTCGAVNFTKPKSWITGNAMVINLDNSTKSIKTFIYYLLSNTNFQYLISGSGQPQITSNIRYHKIKLPNLDEQQKIAEVLTTCDDEINLLNSKLENLKKQKQGLMQKLLKGEIRTCYVKKAM